VPRSSPSKYRFCRFVAVQIEFGNSTFRQFKDAENRVSDEIRKIEDGILPLSTLALISSNIKLELAYSGIDPENLLS
jgi:hypothetical protein